MTKTTTGVATLGVAAVLFLALNGLAGLGLRGARLDFTQNALYTLNDGTRAILSELDEPITLRFYFSRGLTTELPEILTYANRVRELLDEYVAAADGKVRLEEIDPAPFSEEEDEAVALGVQGVPVPPAGDPFYFGLVASNATDERAVIPFFDISQEQLLEYDLTRFVYKLANPARSTVGVLSSLPVMGSPAMQFPGAPPAQPAWYAVEMLRELYDVTEVASDVAAIPDDVDVLLVIHPKGLSDTTLFAIDQFVLGGGRLLAFVDPYCEDDRPPSDPGNPLAGMGQPRDSDLGPLLQAWGLRYDKARVLGDRSAALALPMRGANGRQELIPYITYYEFGQASQAKDTLDEGDPVMVGLGTLRLGVAGTLEPVDGAGGSFQPLLWSTPDSELLDVSQIQFFPQMDQLLADFAPDDRDHTLAARVTGRLSTAFPDGPPDAPVADDETEGPPAPATRLTESRGDAHVVVVADVDMLTDRFWVQFQDFFGTRFVSTSADNGKLLGNLVDSLAGSTDLMKVRSRASFERPFETIEQLRREADLAYREEQRALEARLTEAEQRINDLQREREDGSSLILTPEQQAEIERFQDERIETRTQLRRVQHDLSKDIESLKSRLKFANVLGIPLLIGGLLVLAALRRRG